MTAEAGTLRVAMVTARALPYMGGIETHVHEVSRRLASFGVQVTVLTTDTSGELPTSERVDGYEIRRWPAYPRSRDYMWSPGLYRHLRTSTFDVVHWHGVPPMKSLFFSGVACVRNFGAMTVFLLGWLATIWSEGGEPGRMAFHAAPGTLLIDCSTIDVTTARSNIEGAGAKGLVAVDEAGNPVAPTTPVEPTPAPTEIAADGSTVPAPTESAVPVLPDNVTGQSAATKTCSQGRTVY